MNVSSIRSQIVGCGYRNDLLRNNFVLNGKTVPIVGFSQIPFDTRTSCVIIGNVGADPKRQVEEFRPIGAPLVFLIREGELQWWRLGASSTEWIESVREDHIDDFFEKNKASFAPDAIYRAKTWGRFRHEHQLHFVDIGLMPLVESEIGHALERLIERNVSSLKSRLNWGEAMTDEQGHWLLKSVFWLVSAKILKDKGVDSFSGIDLTNIEQTFATLARHYGTPAIPVSSKLKTSGLENVASDISRFSSLALATTESLAYVYENTLISSATRSELGTHSTPPYLVDYIVGQLAEWIEQMQPEERSVFEPACGHAAFLVSATRLLTELLPQNKSTLGRRRQYLRSRIHGIDRDPFALELARLALTLADIPNPDGWDLQPVDMFLTDDIEKQASQNTILLANPPFEKFTQAERKKYSNSKLGFKYLYKATETLSRAIRALNPGAVFGVVLPQTFLHNAESRDFRQFICEHCELKEICLFPDKVFSFADAESAIIIGRRTDDRQALNNNEIRYRHVREPMLDHFKKNFEASTESLVVQSDFNAGNGWTFKVPDLAEVWKWLEKNPKLDEFARVGQGLIYHGKQLPAGAITYSQSRFDGAVRGFVRFDSGLEIHSLPAEFWLNISDDVVKANKIGTITNVPQVLLNYAPSSRGPWRLKALKDSRGHAVTSRFIVVRPLADSNVQDLNVYWAILNSPVANSFAFSHLSKRDNLAGLLQQFPLPQRGADCSRLSELVAAYFDRTANTKKYKIELSDILTQIDIEVLRLYGLPLPLEQMVLSMFEGYRRVGVPFEFTRYIPSDVPGAIRYEQFQRFSGDWSSANRKRSQLIKKEIAGILNSQERMELDALQLLADYKLKQANSYRQQSLEKLEARVLASGTNG